jgi:hypothetical protein
MPLKSSKSMFGYQEGTIATINKVLEVAATDTAKVGAPKTAEDITKIINIFDALATKLQTIRQ